jgi:addiction module RelB/DinJ family antitoxin
MRKGGVNMATRSANVNARIEPSIKEQAAAILKTLGVSESTFIDMAYRQVVLQKGIPFTVSIPKNIRTRDTMSESEFHAWMAKGLQQAKAGESVPVDEAFEEILAGL